MSKKPIVGEGQIQLDYDSVEPEPVFNSEFTPGVSVKLSERAPYLLAAKKEYSQYSRNRGLVDGYWDGRPDLRARFTESAIERMGGKADEYRHLGVLAVSGAYRLKRDELIKAGFDSNEIDAGEEEEIRDFRLRVVGPDNKNRRERLKKEWEKRQK